MAFEPAIDPVDEMIAKSGMFGWNGHLEYATTFHRPELNGVLALWRTKANGGVPLRVGFEARDFRAVLPNLWMLEEVEGYLGSRYRYRLVGTEIAKVFGETTGKFIDEVVPPSLLPRWTVACAALLRCRAPVRVTTNVDHPRANYLSMESFHAPLLNEEGRATILLCVSFFGQWKYS